MNSHEIEQSMELMDMKQRYAQAKRLAQMARDSHDPVTSKEQEAEADRLVEDILERDPDFADDVRRMVDHLYKNEAAALNSVTILSNAAEEAQDRRND